MTFTQRLGNTANSLRIRERKRPQNNWLLAWWLFIVFLLLLFDDGGHLLHHLAYALPSFTFRSFTTNCRCRRHCEEKEEEKKRKTLLAFSSLSRCLVDVVCVYDNTSRQVAPVSVLSPVSYRKYGDVSRIMAMAFFYWLLFLARIK